MTDRRIEFAGQGYPLLFGANKVAEGYNFAVEIPYGTEAALVLYRKGSPEPEQEIAFREEDRVGNVCTMLLKGVSSREYEYNFRVGGKIVQDPCAYRVHGTEEFGKLLDGADEHQVRCGFLTEEKYDWEGDEAPRIPYEELLLYKIHVRGYTKQYRISPGKRGTFKGLVEMIPYWKELGVNAVELMPAYEFAEFPPAREHEGMVMRRQSGKRINYWGYVPGCYFSPKSSYCGTKKPEKEFRDLVKELHRAGMECIMEMFFPKTVDPAVVLRVLWFWKLYYHVDGFHLLGDGVPSDAVLRDGLLASTKLMLQGVNGDAIPEERALTGKNAAEYSLGFLQSMRGFLKSDEDMLRAVVFHTKRNPERFAAVNFMAYQDGFTLADSVTYNYRHNDENGEDNQDGTSYNFSWNCGIEGPTKKKTVCRIRERQLRNSFLLLLLSQGVPMIYGGDEFGNSQNGNNNAYCQDNPTGWIDWKALRKNAELFTFVKRAIAFRKEHPILHRSREMKGVDYLSKGFPDISFHGERAWYLSYENTSRLMGIMYCGLYAQKEDGTVDDFIYVAYNFHWESRTLALPNLPEKMKWRKLADTSEPSKEAFGEPGEEAYERTIEIGPRTIMILLGR